MSFLTECLVKHSAGEALYHKRVRELKDLTIEQLNTLRNQQVEIRNTSVVIEEQYQANFLINVIDDMLHDAGDY